MKIDKSNTYGVKIIPKTLTRTITKLKVSTRMLNLYTGVNFMVYVIDSTGTVDEIKYVDVADDLYLSWKNDDTFIKSYILQTLNYTEDTDQPHSYDGNDYVINVIPKEVTYILDQLCITFNSLKLFYNATFTLDLKDCQSGITYQTTKLVLTNEQYLQWLEDDTFIKTLALQTLEVSEQ